MSARCCAGQLACCCGSAGCSLCCGCCPKFRQSRTTRFMYLFYFILVIALCCVMMTPSVMKQVKDHIPFFEEFCKKTQAGGDACENLVGYSAVYRVCFGMACFFALFCLLTLKVNNSKSCRAYIHNGFWFFKLLLLGAMCSGAFFIPDQETFLKVWRYVGAGGSFLFICIQLLLIVQFAHKWNKNWYVLLWKALTH